MVSTILITGSSSGIGAETARVAVEKGHKVILHGRNEEHLDKLSKELSAPYICVDVRNEVLLGTVLRAFPDQIDALIHCAGMYETQPLLESTNEHWTRLFEVNTLGFLNVVRAVVPSMIERKRGRIVHVISTRSLPHMANNYGAAYAATKAAALSLTISLAKELAPHITVNALSPGYTLTAISDSWTPHTWERANSVPLRRPARAEEMATALLFLASCENSYMTGQHVIVDGGQTLST